MIYSHITDEHFKNTQYASVTGLRISSIFLSSLVLEIILCGTSKELFVHEVVREAGNGCAWKPMRVVANEMYTV